MFVFWVLFAQCLKTNHQRLLAKWDEYTLHGKQARQALKADQPGFMP